TAIARNNACDLLKKNGWRQNSIEITDDENDPVLEIPDYCDEDELIDDKKRREKLFSEITKLGEPDSSIMFRKYYLGESSKTIADAVGMTPANVDNRAHRAIAKLKKIFSGS
ncbi:MAG: sigma-70 family RNA polymerase sigma factor, partial [Clostridia bacterium]|nr:sigma-70 family RNA polymerase sigma factor [Clostridia bacterium]